MIRRLAFVSSIQPQIGRGWRPNDAAIVATELGLDVLEVRVTSSSELSDLASRHSDILVWPVSFTIGPDVKGTYVTSVLEGLGVPFVGSGSAALAYSSKLLFKGALANRTPYRSPDYLLVEPGSLSSDRIGYPAVLKTEFSTNSKGVVVVDDSIEFVKACAHLRESYGQTIFVERWERAREYTVAYLPPFKSRKATAAALEIELDSKARYLDQFAKNDNTRLRFRRPSADQASRLEEITTQIAHQLGLDGYLRLDFVENVHGQLFPIEVNLLPFLTRSAPEQSYFPMAFELAGRETYVEIIQHIIAHALARAGRDTESGLVKRLVP